MDFNDFNRKRRPIISYFVTAVLGSIFGGALLLMFAPGVLFSNLPSQPGTNPIGSAQQLGTITPVTTSQAITDIGFSANKVIPSVVGIIRPIPANKKTDTPSEAELGTGVIVDPAGFILTNNHVADNSKDLTVSLYNGGNVIGKVVWSDAVLDMSIVKINASNLIVATLGDSQGIKIGDTAIAIGNPLGLKYQRSVTSGIISAVNRTVQMGPESFMEDLIQTDASINPGNSGGPLININGEVIGINTVKVSTAEGMGFAIPINMAKPIIQSIKTTGKFITPVLGIKGVDRDMASSLNYKVDRGVYVYDSVPGSPGYNAGIRVGDVIISMNDKVINSLMDVREVLYNTGINNTVNVTFITSLGAEKTITVKLVPFS